MEEQNAVHRNQSNDMVVLLVKEQDPLAETDPMICDKFVVGSSLSISSCDAVRRLIQPSWLSALLRPVSITRIKNDSVCEALVVY